MSDTKGSALTRITAPGDGTEGLIGYRTSAGASGSRRFQLEDLGLGLRKIPSTGSFTALNAANTKSTDTARGIWMADSQAGDQLRLWALAAPATPYKIRAHFNPCVVTTSAGTGKYMDCIVGARDSGTGKCHMLHARRNVQANVTPIQYVLRWNDSVNSFNAIDITGNGNFVPEWLSLRDDGTNFHWEISGDGDNWLEVGSNGRSAFLASPNQVVFGVLCTTPGPSGALIDHVYIGA